MAQPRLNTDDVFFGGGGGGGREGAVLHLHQAHPAAIPPPPPLNFQYFAGAKSLESICISLSESLLFYCRRLEVRGTRRAEASSYASRAAQQNILPSPYRPEMLPANKQSPSRC